MENNPLHQSLDEVMDAMSESQQLHALEQQFPYLFTKAALFLEQGAETYRSTDFFHEPKTIDPEELTILAVGCSQLCMGKGLKESDPLTELGVTGFYQLMQMMHFQPTSRTTKRGIYIDEIRGTLDCISFRHAMDGRTSTLYNFCVYPKLED